ARAVGAERNGLSPGRDVEAQDDLVVGPADAVLDDVEPERPHRLGRGLPFATGTHRNEILTRERLAHDGEIAEAADEHGGEVERVPLAVRLEAVRELPRLIRELLEPL